MILLSQFIVSKASISLVLEINEHCANFVYSCYSFYIIFLLCFKWINIFAIEMQDKKEFS